MGLFSSKEENKRRQSDADAGEGGEGEGDSSDSMVEERPASAGQPAEDSKEDEETPADVSEKGDAPEQPPESQD